MKKVSILHTGGTLASKVDYRTGGVVSKFSDKDILSMYPEIKDIVGIKSRLIRNMASEDMNFKHYNLMAEGVFKGLKNSDGVIITHGTDTMHYSAAALSFILEGLDKPVILVGAQRSSDRGSSDAGLNLICAAQFIDKSDFSGVGICMHEGMSDEDCLILPGVKTRKLHTSRRDAFRVVNDVAVARVNKNGNIKFFKNLKKEKGKLKLKLINEKLKVGLFKSRPNMFASELKIFSKYDGLVLEGTGLGHFPITKTDSFTEENKKVFGEIKKLSKKIPVVMTSQCLFGRVNMNVYSPGRELVKIGVLGNYSDMLPEVAYIKLAWLLSNYKKDVRKLMGRNLRGEINKRLKDEFL